MARLYKDPDLKKPSLATKLSASAVAGFTAALFSLPFDMLKSRLQDQRPNSQGKVRYLTGFVLYQQKHLFWVNTNNSYFPTQRTPRCTVPCNVSIYQAVYRCTLYSSLIRWCYHIVCARYSIPCSAHAVSHAVQYILQHAV